jgi:hypothetical protein
MVGRRPDSPTLQTSQHSCLSRVWRGKENPHILRSIIGFVWLILLLFPGSAWATRLYLGSGGGLSTLPPSDETRYHLSERQPLEWRMQLKGDMAGSSYGYSIYAETTAHSGISAYVEIVLRSGGTETVLARWRRGLRSTRGVEVFTGSISGTDVEAGAGDVLVLRIGMNKPSTFHEYGGIWVSQRYPSSITVPDFGSLTDVDLQRVRDEFSQSQSQFEQILQQQAENKEKLDQLAAAVERLENMVQELRESRLHGEEKASLPEGAAPVNVRLRFSPTELMVPALQHELFTCVIEMDPDHDIDAVNRGSLKLTGPKGSLKADPSLCPEAEDVESPSSGLKVCFGAGKVAELFDMGESQALFGSLELTGLLRDGQSFRGRGVIQIKKKSANIPTFPPQP